MEDSVLESLSTVFDTVELQVTDPQNVQSSVQDAIEQIPNNLLIEPPVKVQIVSLIKYKTVSDEVLEVHVSTRQLALNSMAELNGNWADEMMKRFEQAAEDAKMKGSGWSEGEILKIELKLSKFAPIRGRSYIPLPPALVKKRAVLNIKNDDDKCFMWCVLARLYSVKKNAERVSNYHAYRNKLNFTGIEFPVSITSIDKFEQQNKPITVNVYTWDEEDELKPVRISKNSPTIGDCDTNHVDMLLMTDGVKYHYTLIRTMSRLMASTSNHNSKQDFCRRCLLRIPSIHAALIHKQHCKSVDDAVVKLTTPPPDSKVYFKNVCKLQKSPYVVYADFESIIVPYEGPLPKDLPKTVTLSNHQVCSYAFIVVSSDGKHSKPQLYRGPNAAKNFLQQMNQVRNDCSKQLNLSDIVMKPEDQEQFNSTTQCWICEQSLTPNTDNPIVRDHDHVSGQFRGAAHSKCNLQLKFDPKTWKLPIFFHNLRGYDSHLIMQAVTDEYKARCIAQSSEKYMAFTLNSLYFYDSAQHLMGTLESLSSSLTAFPITCKYFDSDLVRKGVYPYEYMDSWERFDEDELPPKDAYFSRLKGKGISDEDYEHAKTAWNKLGCNTMGDYHDQYLLADVCLLADIFENYRRTCMKHYNLDPSHYISAPGMSWDAFLRFTGVKIDLLSDLPTLQMIENGLRGGISMASHNYCKANNKYLDDFDPMKPSNYIMYLDANNLYGWAMCQTLPLRNFKIYSGPFSQCVVLTILKAGPDSRKGWILEVDLDYPLSLHDLHNDYPLAAERLKVNPREPPKLVPNLFHKKKYVCHYRLLQFYIRHGLILKAVHRIILFDQEQFMKPYIMKNTELRTKAADASEKDFFKLMNNSCFGKTMENPHKRKDVRLVTRENEAIKLTSKPQYQDFKYFHEQLYGILMKKLVVKLDKPVFIGFTVLELSKLLMLEFLYDYLKPRYPKSRVLYTDTDSFLLDIPADDIYKDLEAESPAVKGKDSFYDTCDYPKESPLHSNVNKKVIGKMKDEMNGKIIKEYVGLRAKMYSVASEKGVVKKAKGVSKQVVKSSISHDNYKEALFQKRVFHHDNPKISSALHQINTTIVNKKSLDANDTKRVYSSPEYSYAIGHWRTNAASNSLSV